MPWNILEVEDTYFFCTVDQPLVLSGSNYYILFHVLSKFKVYNICAGSMTNGYHLIVSEIIMRPHCRFVINKLVRKDLIQTLPLPRRMIDYLSTPHYYSEIVDGAEQQDDFSLNHQNHDTETESDEGIDRARPDNVNNETLNNYVLVRSPIINNAIVGTRQS